MKIRFALLLTLLFLTAPLFAQSTSVTLFVTSSQNGGGDRFGDAGSNVTSEFENGSGFGASIDRSFGKHLSGELALFRISSEGSLREGPARLSLGDVDMMPVTAMLRVHLRRDSPLDIYAGAGAAYVTFDDLDSADLRAEGLAPVKLDSETGFVIGAGLTWSFAERWGATLDARYIPLTLHGSVAGESDSAAIDPLLVSAGLRVRF